MEVCEWMAANAWHQGRKQGRKLHPLKRASAQASFILYKASQFLPHFRKEKKTHQLALLHHNEIGSLRAGGHDQSTKKRMLTNI